MSWESVLGPLLGLVVGAVLTDRRANRKEQQNERLAAGRLLCELMEVRHRLKMMPALLDVVKERFGLSQEMMAYLSAGITLVLPKPDQLASSYSADVSFIAGARPVLAFRLRHLSSFATILDEMKLAIASNKGVPALVSSIDRLTSSSALDAHDEAMIDLAWTHGWVTWYRVRKRLKRPVLEGTEDLLSEVVGHIDRTLKALPPETLRSLNVAPDAIGTGEPEAASAENLTSDCD